MNSRFTLKHLIIAALAGSALMMALIGLAGACIVEFGWFAVGASSTHSRLVYWVTHETMIHAVQAQAKFVAAPPRFTRSQVLRGFQAYDRECVMCHGAPGVARAPWVSGITPTPPYLLDAARQWTPSELKVIVANGLKMTAMPAWNARHPESQAWDLVAFLEQLHGMPAAEYARLRAQLQKASPRAGNLPPGAMK